MNMYKQIKLLFLFLICWSLLGAVAFAEWAKVKYVIDGDTIILENNQRVRLIGIDTPEIKTEYHPKADYYAQESKEYLRQLIEGKRIWLEGEGDQPEYDKYGRRLAYIFPEDKTFINEELIRLGYAKAYLYFPFKYKKEFEMLEQKAKSKSLGMWKKLNKSGGEEMSQESHEKEMGGVKALIVKTLGDLRAGAINGRFNDGTTARNLYLFIQLLQHSPVKKEIFPEALLSLWKEGKIKIDHILYNDQIFDEINMPEVVDEYRKGIKENFNNNNYLSYHISIDERGN